MHGRLKVRTTVEQEEARRREREKKVQVYKQTTGRIYAKRATGELDDEALTLTREVLSQNPDITTLWNYRKEVLLARLPPALSPEEADKLCQSELLLLEQCLRVNPKSYCVWLHRHWVMTHSPSPDWERERKLCSIFLKYDERNFHCWDYLRSVVSELDVPPEEELAFTHEKIASNFSNYSAWHYRSALLPKLHPSPTRQGGVTEEALTEEHELVQNAFFTDPSDQSAWFYHRWLLGKASKPLALACVMFKRVQQPLVYVVFNQPTKVTDAQSIHITVDGAPVVSSLLQPDQPESLWVCSVPTGDISATGDSEIVVKVKFDNFDATVTLHKGQHESWWLGPLEDIFGCSLTSAKPSLLRSELETCQELLQLEPENKWCLLTTQFLMQALDSQKYCSTVTEILKKLITVDPYRQGYYKDLLSKFQIEQSLKEVLKKLGGSSETLDLSGKGLSRLYHTEHMLLFKEISLANNQLANLHGVQHLYCIHTLCLDGNQLETLPEGLAKLPDLRVLSLRNNNITELEGLFGLRGSSVEVLRLEGNPVCQIGGLREKLMNILPQLTACS